MVIDGAVKFYNDNDVTIYTMNNVTTGQYCMVVPSANNGVIQMIIDLHWKSVFDSVSQGSKTKDSLISDLVAEYNKIKTTYNNGILIVPMFDEGEYQTVISQSDKQKMFDLTKKIGAITSELYKKITDSGITKENIDQKIRIVLKSDDDTKFVNWLMEQMPNFVEGYSMPKEEVASNPLMGGTNLFGTPSPEVPTNNNPEPPTTDIFGTSNVTPTPVVTPLTDVQPVTTEVSTQPVTDIFGANPTPVPPTNTTNLFAESTPEPTVQSTPSQPIEVAPDLTKTTSIEVPKPVTSTPLEATITVPPIAQETSTEPVTEEEVPNRPGSKGIVNLLILVVVLFGVSLVSVELGKFLFNVYGGA